MPPKPPARVPLVMPCLSLDLYMDECQQVINPKLPAIQAQAYTKRVFACCKDMAIFRHCYVRKVMPGLIPASQHSRMHRASTGNV